jgi:para-aminobenzoate synthetase component 1
MKGTIDASIPNAKEKILNDEKEFAEHTMVVDLLRNDLNIVSKNVRVEKFRYIDKIRAGQKELLQVSSKISGDLSENWHSSIGDILLPLLPAGSISGTPKKKTVELINEIESYDRDFFSGIWGVYNGNTLDSSILIRFIENNQGVLYYKSGGGITIDSNIDNEYNEMKDKVYIP